MHGKGRMTWKNGTMYEGDFVYDKRTGNGSKMWTSGPFKGDIYTGDFIEGKRTGKGVYYYNSDHPDRINWKGSIYKGDFVND